jgi:hypothetical protein
MEAYDEIYVTYLQEDRDLLDQHGPTAGLKALGTYGIRVDLDSHRRGAAEDRLNGYVAAGRRRSKLNLHAAVARIRREGGPRCREQQDGDTERDERARRTWPTACRPRLRDVTYDGAGDVDESQRTAMDATHRNLPQTPASAIAVMMFRHRGRVRRA